MSQWILVTWVTPCSVQEQAYGVLNVALGEHAHLSSTVYGELSSKLVCRILQGLEELLQVCRCFTDL